MNRSSPVRESLNSGGSFSGKLVVQPTDVLVPALVFPEFRRQRLAFPERAISDREVAPVRYEGAGGRG
jgi:hypothetical protein